MPTADQGSSQSSPQDGQGGEDRCTGEHRRGVSTVRPAGGIGRCPQKGEGDIILEERRKLWLWIGGIAILMLLYAVYYKISYNKYIERECKKAEKKKKGKA